MKPGIAYFAGFFDGEGSISVKRPSKTSYFLLSCSVANTDPRPLDHFRARFGGSVKGPYSRGERCKPIFYWQVDAKKAEAFLHVVCRYLIIKAERAKLGLRFRKLFTGKSALPRGLANQEKFRVKRETILHERENVFSIMKKLNKRGA